MSDLERADALLYALLVEDAPQQEAMLARALAAARREGAEEMRKQTDAVIQGFAHRWMETGAADMRERAAQAAADYVAPIGSAGIARAIRALPLTPEER